MEKISRKLLLDLVTQWEAGSLNEVDVHEKAEELWEQDDWPEYAEEDPRSIAIEVLSQLEILNHQLIIKDDIPAIIAFLKTPEGKERSGWSAWKQYWDSIDLTARKATLKDNLYYST
jgi:hypothetical protein